MQPCLMGIFNLQLYDLSELPVLSLCQFNNINTWFVIFTKYNWDAW